MVAPEAQLLANGVRGFSLEAVESGEYGVDPLHPWGTNYGSLVFAKIALFGLALAAAAINQFIHLRRWDPAKEKDFSRGVYREVGLEIPLMVAVFIAAGFLTRTDLPGDYRTSG